MQSLVSTAGCSREPVYAIYVILYSVCVCVFVCSSAVHVSIENATAAAHSLYYYIATRPTRIPYTLARALMTFHSYIIIVVLSKRFLRRIIIK